MPIDPMQEAARLMQTGKTLEAFHAFREIADTTPVTEQLLLARARQMAGVTARLMATIERSEEYLKHSEKYLNLALGLAIRMDDQVLTATVLRDLGPTQELRFDLTGEAASLEKAQDSYTESVAILETLLDMSSHRTEHLKLRGELLTTQSFQEMLNWEMARTRKLRNEAKVRLWSCYVQTKALNAVITEEAQRGLLLAPFEEYQTNTLVRLVRVSSLPKRLTYGAELMRLTDESSASPGRRKHAYVALVGGNWLYKSLPQLLWRYRQARRWLQSHLPAH